MAPRRRQTTLARKVSRLGRLYRRCRKAVVAFVVPCGGSFGAAMALGDFTRSDLFTGIGLGLTACFGVYQVPNEPATDE